MKIIKDQPGDDITMYTDMLKVKSSWKVCFLVLFIDSNYSHTLIETQGSSC